MSVLVYSGDNLIEAYNCKSEKQAQSLADYWQDEGYTVRILEN